jgi:hypothetical protein
MQPITRSQLQNLYIDAEEEKKKASVREQEAVGELFANVVYNRVVETAKMGKTRYEAHFPTGITSIGHDRAMMLFQKLFPDSDVSTVIYDTTTIAIRIHWGETKEEAFYLRRLEKETCW